MGGALFPPCCLTWSQTVVEVMKIMRNSFKRSHACTVTISAHKPAAGHHQSMTLPKDPGHMGKSGLVSCGVTAPSSWVLVRTRFCLYPPSVCFPSPVLSSGGFMLGLMATSSKRAYAIPRSAAPKAPAPDCQQAVHCWLVPLLKGRSGSVSVGSPGVHRFCLSPLKHLWKVWGLILNAVLPLLLSCCSFSFALGHGISFFFFLVGSNILLSMVVQQRVVILEFSLEKMSTPPSTLPSWISCWNGWI